MIVKLTPSDPYDRPVIPLDLEDMARSMLELALRSLGSNVKNITALHAYTAPFEGLIVPTLSPRKLSVYRSECKDEALSGLHRLLKLTGDAVRWKVSVRYGDPRSVLLGRVHTSRGSDGASSRRRLEIEIPPV